MRYRGSVCALVIGLVAGAAGVVFWPTPTREVGAATNDRFGEFVMATGAVSLDPRIQTDGVWLLDYRSGKLLGTVIDKERGKIMGWAEVDLLNEFQLQRRQDVHFMMTTGYITQTQSALYLAETSTGKFGVYTMGPGPDGLGIVIRRHDLTSFRQVVGDLKAPPVFGGQPAGKINGLVEPGIPQQAGPAALPTAPAQPTLPLPAVKK